MRPVWPLYMTSFPCFWKPILCRVLLTLATVTSVKGVASPSVPVSTPTFSPANEKTTGHRRRSVSADRERARFCQHDAQPLPPHPPQPIRPQKRQRVRPTHNTQHAIFSALGREERKRDLDYIQHRPLKAKPSDTTTVPTVTPRNFQRAGSPQNTGRFVFDPLSALSYLSSWRKKTKQQG